jgi:hypothetical protein
VAKFIQCSQPVNTYFRERPNSPVNIDLVAEVQREQYKLYPDNEGRPAIRFSFPGNSYTHWVYADAASRDKEYENIITNVL